MLAKKLAIKPSSHCLIINPNQHEIPEIQFVDIEFANTSLTPNWILLVAANLKELETLLTQNQSTIKQGEIIWIAYPKQSSKLKSDINRDTIWKLILHFSLTPNSQISINETWSAVRFKNAEMPAEWVEKFTQYGSRNKADLANRPEIIVPQELQLHFNNHPEAAQFYEGLSYTCRKEYAQYVAEAKKPETRIARAEKTIQALINKKKQF